MRGLFLILPLIVFGMGIAYAEPLGEIQTSVLEYSNNTATVQILWNEDAGVSYYQIGCVSCFPNMVNSTTESNIVLENVTPFPNGSIAVLYGLAYDIENNLVAAKQIFIDLTQ
jgi:hypothetical protein